jgi:hypothetical protein
MAIKPVVRYMIPCEDWHVSEDNSRRITVIGLLSNIDSIDDPPYPLLFPELCVFLALTEGRGNGQGWIKCVYEETGQAVFATPMRRIDFGSDPLDIISVVFRIRDCPFPISGLYIVQFWYEGELIDERPIRLR